jgi:hypothetical protein
MSKSRMTYWPDQIWSANIYSAQLPIRYLGSISLPHALLQQKHAASHLSSLLEISHPPQPALDPEAGL